MGLAFNNGNFLSEMNMHVVQNLYFLSGHWSLIHKIKARSQLNPKYESQL